MSLQFQHFFLRDPEAIESIIRAKAWQEEINFFLRSTDITILQNQHIVIGKLLVVSIMYSDKTPEEMAQEDQMRKMAAPGFVLPPTMPKK